MNLFAFISYKEFFRAYIRENKQRGLISRIAASCGCDRTYLSQVLNGKADLTPDHLVQFCDRIGYKETETRYLLLLLLRDRSSSPAARKYFEMRLIALRKKNAIVTDKILNREHPGEVTEELRTLYYSNWLYGAAHILTSVPAFQTAPALAEKLHVSVDSILRLLKDLIAMGLVRKEAGHRYTHLGTDLYLPREAPQSHSHHLNWRMRAVERSRVAENVHYTTAFSLSQGDVEALRNQILGLIEVQRNLVRASGTDVAYAFCVDFFEI